MEIRRGVLNAAQRERFDRSIGGHHHSIHGVLLVEPLCLKVMHAVVGVVRRLMARRTLPLTEEYFLAVHLCGVALAGSSLPSYPTFAPGGKARTSRNPPMQ